MLEISPPDQVPREVSIDLPASKSIYNRLLIMQALAGRKLFIPSEVRSKDTVELEQAMTTVDRGETLIFTGEGGTTFRFLLAYLAQSGFRGELRAEGSMKHRPIGPLVHALNTLGADIRCISGENEAAVFITPSEWRRDNIRLSGELSSQFITALMLIAPYLPHGLRIEISGQAVSFPYIEMTARLMTAHGVPVRLEESCIEIPAGTYESSGTTMEYIESDWTAASYFWMHANILGIPRLCCKNLGQRSVQGDAALHQWAIAQGWKSYFIHSDWYLEKTQKSSYYFGDSFSLSGVPDIALSLISLYAFFRAPATFSGLSSLIHKESNRIQSLQREWGKFGLELAASPKGRIDILPTSHEETPISSNLIDSHGDHRIAMCMSSLAAAHKIRIQDSSVVEKSFPAFWQQLEKLDYTLRFTESPKS
jgi:3-phosphoshikimate 1-carboxyvinyltransferase